MTDSIRITIDKTGKAGIHRVRLHIAGYTFTCAGYVEEDRANEIASDIKQFLEGRPVRRTKKEKAHD